jgi:hypothetical protein
MGLEKLLGREYKERSETDTDREHGEKLGTD